MKDDFVSPAELSVRSDLERGRMGRGVALRSEVGLAGASILVGNVVVGVIQRVILSSFVDNIFVSSDCFFR